jgi:Family of unknown function (DUF6445)
MRSVIVVDDFYDDPDAIRDLALTLPYRKKPGATYPGREAASDHDWRGVRERLRSHIDEPCDEECPKDPPFRQGKFRLALAADEQERIDRVHVDQQRWSGIVYLTRPGDSAGGLALYRHRASGLVTWPGTWLRANVPELFSLPRPEAAVRLLAYCADPENFEQIGLIPMAYNRAILLMAQVLHGTGRAFGNSPEEGRLSQHFEFYA